MSFIQAEQRDRGEHAWCIGQPLKCCTAQPFRGQEQHLNVAYTHTSIHIAANIISQGQTPCMHQSRVAGYVQEARLTMFAWCLLAPPVCQCTGNMRVMSCYHVVLFAKWSTLSPVSEESKLQSRCHMPRSPWPHNAAIMLGTVLRRLT